MSETFDKLLENRDYWRDEAKASWANIEALEVGNSRLEEEISELRQEIHRLQAKADERLASYAERIELPELLSTKDRIREIAERKTKEARDRVAKEVSQLNLDLAAWTKRQEGDQEAQDLEKYNQRFFDPDSLKSGLSVELEGTASQEVFDLIMGKPPEQELREITMVAKIVDDQPAHEEARPPRRTRRRIRRYRR